MTIQPLEGESILVGLEGRFDIEGAQSIEDQFTFTTATKARRVVVDLSGVDFMASIGIRTLFTAARAQSNRGGRVVLAAPTEMVRKVLVTAGVDQVIPLFDSVADALAQGPSN
jgi:anti-sigma B factor antagonist